jgi:ABC-2 type transport system permease protein
MKVLPMLVRREFWEHRALLVIAPLALCVLYLILCVLAGVGLDMNLVQFGLQSSSVSAAFLIVMHTLFTVLLYLLMAVVAFFYLCDCLYAERKDRSILFWKSLPVSDAATVLSKLLVALIAIPAVVYVLSLLTNIIAFGVLKALSHSEPPANAVSDWTLLGWLRLNGYLIIDIFVLALWYAPVAAYQLLISAVVPRAPFVFTVLPPLALIFGEALFFGTWHIGQFIGYRLGAVQFAPRAGRGVQDVIDALNALPLLGRLDLWIGVLVAAAVIALTIRIRRHRDDS